MAGYKTTEIAINTGTQKTPKEPFFGLQKNKPFLRHQKNSYVRNFGLFLVLMGPKNAFFGAMDFPCARKVKRAFTVDCFDDIALFLPLLAPAAF